MGSPEGVGVAPAVYPPLRLAFPARRDWVFSGVLAQWARRAPDRSFLQYAMEAPLTYGEVDRRVNRLVPGLRALGVGPGDRVLVMLPTSVEFLLVWWAANRIGAVEVSVNNAYKGYFREGRPLVELLVGRAGELHDEVADAGLDERGRRLVKSRPRPGRV